MVNKNAYKKRLQYRYGSMMNLYSCSREKAGKT